MPRRLPNDGAWSPAGGVETSGGEYCVPTSTVVFAAVRLVGAADSGLPGAEALAGERETLRERADIGGDRMGWCGEFLFGNRCDPL
jgi:hypothetical protein